MLSITFSFILLGFYNTQNAYVSENELVKEQSLNLSKNLSKFVGSYFDSKLTVLKGTANGLKNEPFEVDNTSIFEKLTIAKEASDSALMFIGFEKNGYSMTSKGNFLTPEKDNYDSTKRSWYKASAKKNTSGVTLPYISKSLQKQVVSLYSPIIINGKRVGVLGSDILLDDVIKVVLEAKLAKTGYAYIVDKSGKILVHKKKELLMKNSKIFKKMKTKEDTKFDSVTLEGVEYFVSYSKIPNTDWYICIKVPKDEVFVEINEQIIDEILLYLFLLIFILIIQYISLTKILSTLSVFENGLYKFFKYLKGEEKNAEKLNIQTQDEFGLMAKVIDEEMEIISRQIEDDKALIEDVKNVVNRVKEGKLDYEVTQQTSSTSLTELKENFNAMIQSIKNDVNSDINSVIDVLNSYSTLDFTSNVKNPEGNIAHGLNDLCVIITKMLQENQKNGLELNASSAELVKNVNILNTSSTQTAVSLEETASSIEEITSTVISNTSKIAVMSQYSNALTESIDEGKKLANSTVTSMEQINEEANAIADAISVIDQIAFQTNILSLNAAVEAATAGEAGKGFAVVAGEVRNLAARSAEAAHEIKALVINATTRASEGKVISDKMIDGYIKINENIHKTTEIIKDISESSHEQKVSIEQINDVVNRLDTQTQQNASVAVQTQDIANDTSRIANMILQSAQEKKFNE